MNKGISKSVTPVTKITKVRNNRKNGKKYEGELVRILKDMGISARLGRSNEEGDVILSKFNCIIECKSTNLKDRYRISKAPEQFLRLKSLSQEVWYAIRYKGDGISGWKFYPIPNKIQILYKNEGLSLQELTIYLSSRIEQENLQNKKDDKICRDVKTDETEPLKMSNRRVEQK